MQAMLVTQVPLQPALKDSSINVRMCRESVSQNSALVRHYVGNETQVSAILIN